MYILLNKLMVAFPRLPVDDVFGSFLNTLLGFFFVNSNAARSQILKSVLHIEWNMHVKRLMH